MRKADRNLGIIIISVIIVVIIQLIRMDYIIVWNRLENYINELKPEDLKVFNYYIEQADNTLLLYDETNSMVKENIEVQLNNLRVKYDSVNVKTQEVDFSGYQKVLISFSNWDLVDFGKLLSFVSDGTNLVIFSAPDTRSHNFLIYYRKVGIYEYGDFVQYDSYQMNEDILIGRKGKEYLWEEPFDGGLLVRLSEECKIYMTANKNLPVIWEIPFGKGKIIVYNGLNSESKLFRGILTGIIARAGECFVYPVINAKVFQIDDFPSPFIADSDKLKSLYGLDYSRFVNEIWWPDIVSTIRKYNIKYTGFIIGTYNDNVEPPFGFEDVIETNLLIYGRELVKYGGELGLHGYNHQPLELENSGHDFGYNPWKQMDNMIDALEHVKALIRKVYPFYNVCSYVPPSNILSEEGIQALKTVFPNLKAICARYQGEDYEYLQEFSVRSDGIVNFPRITSGYRYNSIDDFVMASGITSLGVISHYIHPDDIIDEERSRGLDWGGLLKELDKMLKDIDDNYKWIEAVTTAQAAVKTKKYFETDISFEKNQNGITIYCDKLYDYFDVMVYTEKPLKRNSRNIVKVSDNYYLVRLTKNNTVLSFED